MQKEFKPLVEEATALCKNYFAQKLLAAYLHGSVATGDAIPYVSDLDYYIVISEELRDEDNRSLERIKNELRQKYPVANGIHLSAHSVADLAKDKFARFALKYNSALYFGSDIVKKLDNCESEKFEPNAKTAKGRLDFARQCFYQALDSKQPACTGEIPADTYYASRKYARYFVIIEGAYFLMSKNDFESFEKNDVLNKLYKYADGFEKELNMTRERNKMISKTEQSRIAYNKIAAEYDAQPEGRYTRFHIAELSGTVELCDGDFVLDVACGNGTYCEYENHRMVSKSAKNVPKPFEFIDKKRRFGFTMEKAQGKNLATLMANENTFDS